MKARALNAFGRGFVELDLATVVRTIQALTSEIVLENWTSKVLTIALEDAGARRGVLVLLGNGDVRTFAEGTVTPSGVEVRVVEAPVVLPDTVLRYVERSGEVVVLDDASIPNEFSLDQYFAGGRHRSILCLPLAKQSTHRGILYLENDLAPRAFTPKRTALLKLLASQAALSLENVWLHTDLQREKVFLAEAQRVAHIGSWLFNAAGFDSWSPELFRIYGLDPNRKPPTTEEYMALVHPADRALVAQAIRKMLADHNGFDFTKRIVRPNGETRWVRCVGIAATHEGKFRGFVGTGIDVTEQHQGQVALQNAQAELARVMRVSALGELAASIAHELRQPLAAIAADAIAALNWLGFDPPNLDEVRGAVTAIDADCQRASDVLARINAMLKSEPPVRTTCNLNAIVSATIPLVRSQFDSKGVSLETELDRELPSTRGDAVELQQVLINLLLNAVDACFAVEPKQRRVVIRTTTERRRGQAWSVVSVADTGNGIDSKVRTRIFDAFYTSKPHGLGMGLSISRSIVLRHDGELTVSPNPPRGASFSVSLPSLP
jgi:PAS domain S-box-containing protein